ncbi:glycosyltransferase family 4 protein [Hymenobacter crusticola]|uniref:Glycosyltransferase WbuB n=1 Tax=Hymenobacter crusticola TaxID=1770526 RepID=A0A243WDH2_9BACT|nr:glycosyltransferase family 4 protein [Hymenobacter crusticola]OUJ73652.1 glycosyltransferase WbuB [Hymenobacter crusticola]
MHIAVFSQYHTNPDCPATSRHYSLLRHIARTHRVTLLTTRTWEQQRLTQHYTWLPEGVEMRAAQVPYRNTMGVAQRGLAFAHYAAYAVREGLRIDKPDVIWGISTPLTAAWAAAQVARWRRVPWVFEVQDLWPAFPIAMGAVPRFAWSELHKMEHKLYHQAQAIMTLSPDMTDYVKALGNIAKSPWPFNTSKVHTSLNGTDLDLAAFATEDAVMKLRQELGLTKQRVVLYAGTFGRANAIPMLVQAAEQLAAIDANTVWLFMGHGFYEPLVRAAAARCAAIRLVAPQPRYAVFAWFRLADVSVVSFLNLPVLDSNSPAKLYDSLAVSTPVIVTNEGWTKRLVEQHACGWYVPADDTQALVTQLTQLFAQPEQLLQAGERGRALAIEQFDRGKIATAVQVTLEQAARSA